jgi:hypothetical protein
MMNGQPPSEGIENLTPERAKHRTKQLNKIEDLKSKITTNDDDEQSTWCRSTTSYDGNWTTTTYVTSRHARRT